MKSRATSPTCLSSSHKSWESAPTCSAPDRKPLMPTSPPRRIFHQTIFVAWCIFVLVLAHPVTSQDSSIRAPSLGINHISAPDDPISAQRYGNALLLGAGWNRWPLYWNAVENLP